MRSKPKCDVCGRWSRTMIRDKTVHPERVYCPDHWNFEEAEGIDEPRPA